jgi:plasmid stabilization system protein ParE
VNLVVARAAAADLERLRQFLADKDPTAARRAAAMLREAVQSLDAFPDRGRPAAVAGLRELIVPFGRSGYVIRYAHFPERNEVVIIRIWHSREARE